MGTIAELDVAVDPDNIKEQITVILDTIRPLWKKDDVSLQVRGCDNY